MQDTVYNNSTHLYWIYGLQWTDQFSVSYVGVSLYILPVCLSLQKWIEATGLQQVSSSSALNSNSNFTLLLCCCCCCFFRITFMLLLIYKVSKEVNSLSAMSNCFSVTTVPKCELPAVPWQRCFGRFPMCVGWFIFVCLFGLLFVLFVFFCFFNYHLLTVYLTGDPWNYLRQFLP